jgi:hypothetical protein
MNVAQPRLQEISACIRLLHYMKKHRVRWDEFVCVISVIYARPIFIRTDTFRRGRQTGAVNFDI